MTLFLQVLLAYLDVVRIRLSPQLEWEARGGGGKSGRSTSVTWGIFKKEVGMVYVGILKSPGKYHILKALPRIEYMEDTGEFS